MKFKYLYQDRSNKNQEGWIEAKSRDDAYTRLRKQGIRPYRVIGDDPWNWRPFAVAAGYAVLVAALVTLAAVSLVQARQIRELQAERAWLGE